MKWPLLILPFLLFISDAQKTVTFNGVVVDQGTTRPVKEATVQTLTLEMPYRSTTDAQGKFLLILPADVKRVRIRVTKDGYIPREDWTDVVTEIPRAPIELERVVKLKPKPTPPSSQLSSPLESIRPHLQTRLVIDSIPQDADIEFHIEVENISQLQINGLRAGMRTTEMTSQDVSMPRPPTLPPGGRLSIPGSPVSGLKRHGVLFLDLNYESEIAGKTNKSISSYSFLVRPVDMKPQALLPTTWQEQAGVILGPEQKTAEVALKTLAGPTGTMLFALPLLRPDGSPNLLVMTNNKRKFSFDGGSRFISFTTTTSIGNLKTISHTLPDGSYEAIVIGCLWDDQKDEAKLIISGKEFP